MNTVDELQETFKHTAKAHHDAYIAVNGADPDWAMWYANALKPKFDALLDAELSKSEIVALLLSLEQEHAARASEELWTRFYAESVAERYVYATGGLSLYYFPSCPYCRLVTREIDKLGITVELRNVHEDSRWREELVAARGRGTVPVLRCEDGDGTVHWMPESRDIIKYLHTRGS